MSYKKIQSLDADKTTAVGGRDKKTGKTNPNQVEGYYLGKRVVTGARGDSNLHFLQTAQGNLGVWGKTDMDRKLSSAQIGAITRITHVGMTKTPNGDMYRYDVEQDPDNVIDVSSLAPSESSSSEEEFDGGDDYEGGYDNGDSSEETVRPALSAAERSAKVNALLKGKKN
jgi:hypothetical protein